MGVWPLKVFSAADAAAGLPALRTIASAYLHNLAFRSSYRLAREEKKAVGWLNPKSKDGPLAAL